MRLVTSALASAILLMTALVAPVEASGPEILEDVQVSDLRIIWSRWQMTSDNYYWQYCRGRRYRENINVDGVINSDTSFILENLLRQISQANECSPRKETPRTLVFLNSNGGSVNDGFNIGKLFDKYNVATVVLSGDICASSCAIAFLGGTTRGIGGRLIFHAPYRYVGSTRQINCNNTAVNAELRSYYRWAIGSENGDRLYDRTMRYCSTDDGWTVNKDAALMYGISNYRLNN